MVNGSIPRSSSSRATRIAKASESNPVSCSERSSVSGGRLTFCSAAISFIAAMILNFVDMGWLAFCKNCRGASYGANVKQRRKGTETLPPLVNGALAETTDNANVTEKFLKFLDSDCAAHDIRVIFGLK